MAIIQFIFSVIVYFIRAVLFIIVAVLHIIEIETKNVKWMRIPNKISYYLQSLFSMGMGEKYDEYRGQKNPNTGRVE